MDLEEQYRADLIKIYNETSNKETNGNYLLTKSIEYKITSVALRSEHGLQK